MDIAPIGGYDPIAEIQRSSADLELAAVARVENSARTGRDTSKRRHSPARQDSDVADSEPETEDSTGSQLEDASGSKINLFA